MEKAAAQRGGGFFTPYRSPDAETIRDGQSIVPLAAGGLAGDVLNVGAVDADILQFAVGIGRQFVQNIPVTTTLFQESRDE
jgi:hypothetical protein